MLRQHQIEGAEYLAAHPRAYLGDVPRLGKTRTLLEAARLAGAKNPLVVCPAIVRTHWVREHAQLGTVQFAPIVKSYDEITRGGYELMACLILEEQIDALIVDEAHYCKHASAQRTQILFGANGYARRLPIVWPASGTPVSKNPFEFWTILASTFPEVALKHGLRTADDFKARFCVTRPMRVRGKMVEKILAEIRNEDEFREILGQVMLRRTLDDVGLDVPTIDWQITRLDARELPLIPEMGYVETEEKMHRALHVDEDLAAIANDPHVARMRRRLGELKVAPVTQMIASHLADSEEKLVVFAHHQSVLHALRELLQTFGVAYIDGDTPPAKRDEAIARFREDPRCRVFLGQNIACQTGIDLSSAYAEIQVEPDWTADVNVQCGNRIVKIGDASRRVVQMIALAGTLDEAIVAQNLKETRMAQRTLQ